MRNNPEPKRAVVWNAHWQTVGGGERFALSIVHSLIKLDYEVLVLGTCEDPDELLMTKFNSNLGEAVYQKITGEQSIRPLAQFADIFINASFGSTLPAPIKNSYYVCHFPEISRGKKILNKVFSSKHNTAATTSGHRLFPDKLGRLIATDDIYLENKKYPNILIWNC